MNAFWQGFEKQAAGTASLLHKGLQVAGNVTGIRPLMTGTKMMGRPTRKMVPGSTASKLPDAKSLVTTGAKRLGATGAVAAGGAYMLGNRNAQQQQAF